MKIATCHDRAIKIALLSFWYPPETGGGGIATDTRNLAMGLKSLGVEIQVIAGAKESGFKTRLKNGVPVTRCWAGFPYDVGFRVLSILKLRWTSSRLRTAATMLYAFWKLNRIHHFDIVQGPECGAETFFIKLFFPKIKTVVKLQSPLYLIGHYDQITNFDLNLASWFEICGIKNANLILGISKSFANKVAVDLSLQRDIQIVPNCVNIQEIEKNLDPRFNFRKKQNLPPDTKVVLFIGRLELRKGIRIFEEVIPKVVSQLPKTVFVFIGAEHGYSQKEMIIKLKKYKVEKKALFLGSLPYKKTMNILSQADVLVLPSLYEPFGIVLAEAMVCRKPIVGANAGGIPEVVENGKTGILVKPKDAKGFSQAILEFLKSPKKSRSFGDAGRKRVERLYSHLTVARQTLRVYQKFL